MSTWKHENEVALFHDRLMRQIEHAIKDSVDKIIDQAKTKVETEVKRVAAQVALTISQEAELRRMSDNLIITLKIPEIK